MSPPDRALHACLWVSAPEDAQVIGRLPGGVDGLFQGARAAGLLAADPVPVHVGEATLDQALAADVPLVYLPFSGLNPSFVGPLSLRRGRPTFFSHLFQPDDLAVHLGEGDPVSLLRRAVRDGPGLDESPYLDLVDAETADRLSRWITSAAALAVADHHLREREQETARRAGLARRFLDARQPSPDGLATVGDLAATLLRHRQTCALLQCVEDAKRAEDELRDEHTQAHQATEAQSQDAFSRIRKKVHKTDFVYNLGDEILPELQRTLGEAEQFAETIADEPGGLHEIALGLRDKLRQKRPVLTLLGTFSSGKTTLLNTLLFGKNATRAFPTKRVSNTSVVFELTATEGADERAQFVFRDRISHVVFDAAQSGLTAAKNTNTIRRLMEAGVCRNSQLIVRLALTAIPEPQTIGYQGRDKVANALADVDRADARQDALFDDGVTQGRLLTATYLADVDHDRLESHLGDHLPRQVDLSADGGWERLIGGEAETESAESAEAPFLVDRAEVFLHNDLLKLTTLADTPGTGSFNDRHDTVTQQYLGKADAILFLLSTKDDQTDRARRLLETLREHYAEKYKGDLRRGLGDIAFVVNVFAGLTRADAVKRIRDAERAIQDLFEISEAEWKALQGESPSFFAVQLKHVEAGSNQAHLYSYPSLSELRKWISRRLRSGAYAARVRGVLAEIDDDWRRRRVALTREADEVLADDRQRREAKAAAVREKETLTSAADGHRRYLRQVADDLEGNEVSLYHTALGQIHSARDSPPERADGLKDLEQFLVKQAATINQRLAEFAKADVGNDWREHVRARLDRLGARAPALLAPQPDHGSPPWEPGLRMAAGPLAKSFEEVRNNWPGWWRRGWRPIRRLVGSTEPRAVLMNGIASEWESQFRRIWNGLSPFVDRLDSYLENSLAVARGQLDERAVALDNPGDPARQAALGAEQAAFDRHAPERDRLVAQLHAHINA